MNLFEAISQAIGHDKAYNTNAPKPEAFNPAKAVRGSTLTGAVSVTNSSINKPILQLSALPITINPDNYRNPRSTSNPNGSLKSLWAFRQLVDPVPMFTRYYSPSLESTESTYSLIANSASITTDSPFTAGVIAESQQRLSLSRYANMDGTPGTWAPVYATPSDWYETTGGRYKTIDFDLKRAGNVDSPFAIIGKEDSPRELKICSSCAPTVSTPLDPDSHVKKITLKYLQVSLSRPWFNELLFNTNGWRLSDQPPGFCSSGNIQTNDGAIPLIPTSILLACDVTVDAQWAASDQKRIDEALTKGNQVSLDHLVIFPKRGSLQVMGLITALVPFSPKSS